MNYIAVMIVFGVAIILNVIMIIDMAMLNIRDRKKELKRQRKESLLSQSESWD